MRRSPLVRRRSGSTRLFASTTDALHASGNCLSAEVVEERLPWSVRHCQSGQLALVVCHGEELSPTFSDESKYGKQNVFATMDGMIVTRPRT